MDPRENENHSGDGVQTCGGTLMLLMILPLQTRALDLRDGHEIDTVDLRPLGGRPKPLDRAVAWGYTFAS